MKRAWAYWIFPVGILAYVFFLFWPARYDLPRRDQPSLMMERRLYSNRGEWFFHVLSFSRSRDTHRGDALLFRPGTTGILAVADTFFRDRLLIIGLFSIFTFAGLCIASYFFLLPSVGPPLSLLFALFLASKLQVAELVTWRHITGYQFSLLLYIASAWAMERRRERLALVTLFVSFFFHEWTVLAAILLVVLGYQRKRLLIALAIYLVLNLSEFLILRPELVSHPTPITANWIERILLPFWVWVGSFQSLISTELWFPVGDWWSGAWWPRYLAAVALIALLWRRGSRAFSVGLLSISLLLGVGRGWLRGGEYIAEAVKYYFGLTNFLWLLWIAPLLSPWLHSRWRKWTAMIVLTGLVSVQTVRMRAEVSTSEMRSGKALQHHIDAVSREWKDHPDWCLAARPVLLPSGEMVDGVPTAAWPRGEILLPLFFEEHYCVAHQGRSTPMALVLSEEKIALSPLPMPLEQKRRVDARQPLSARDRQLQFSANYFSVTGGPYKNWGEPWPGLAADGTIEIAENPSRNVFYLLHDGVVIWALRR